MEDKKFDKAFEDRVKWAKQQLLDKCYCEKINPEFPIIDKVCVPCCIRPIFDEIKVKATTDLKKEILALIDKLERNHARGCREERCCLNSEIWVEFKKQIKEAK